MKILATESQVWWIGVADELRSPNGIIFPDFFAKLQEEFQFFTPPNPAAPPSEGLTFSRGALRDPGGDVSVASVTLYVDGVQIVIAGDTTSADKVLRKMLDIARSFGVRTPADPLLHYHVSQLVVDFLHPIENITAPNLKLFELIASLMDIKGEMKLGALYIHADPLTVPRAARQINPTAFRLERRANTDFDKNRYFSVANMTTESHVEVLTAIEQYESVAGS